MWHSLHIQSLGEKQTKRKHEELNNEGKNRKLVLVSHNGKKIKENSGGGVEIDNTTARLIKSERIQTILPQSRKITEETEELKIK